jgi:hypothetical protein
MRSLFRRFVAYFVTVAMLLSEFTWPGQGMVMAATLTSGGTLAAHTGACDINDPNVLAGMVTDCRVATSPSGTKIAYPALHWSTVATLAKNPTSGWDLEYLAGNKVNLSGLRSAQMLGINPDQAADMVNTFPVGVPVVLARYTPGTADLRIDIFKSEKTSQGLKLVNAVFGPHHGGWWAAAGSYAEPSAKRAGEFGVNPFSRFADANDDVFHNISLDGVEVAVGHAMRMVQAPVGLLAVADYRFNQYKTTKKNLLKKSVTQHIDGYVKPNWMMAASSQMQPTGTTAVICAKDMGDGVGCPAYLVAPSVVTFDNWSGGNLQENEDKLYAWSKTYSGWTVLSFVLLTFVAFALITTVAMSAGLITTPSQLSLTATAIEAMTESAFGVLATSAIQAATYGVVAFASGASSLLDIQRGYGGTILTSGLQVPSAPANEHQAALLSLAKDKMTNAPVEGSLTAVRGTSYGDCDVRTAAANCAGTSGFLPRADTYKEQDYVQFYRDNGAPERYDSGISGLGQ